MPQSKKSLDNMVEEWRNEEWTLDSWTETAHHWDTLANTDPRYIVNISSVYDLQITLEAFIQNKKFSNSQYVFPGKQNNVINRSKTMT
ncbi:MAG: hypothetical protein OXC40_06305 [Proteobacteria bacterium]|nr:hypothetical protein [Pseudomonadota bacterium]